MLGWKWFLSDYYAFAENTTSFNAQNYINTFYASERALQENTRVRVSMIRVSNCCRKRRWYTQLFFFFCFQSLFTQWNSSRDCQSGHHHHHYYCYLVCYYEKTAKRKPSQQRLGLTDWVSTTTRLNGQLFRLDLYSCSRSLFYHIFISSQTVFYSFPLITMPVMMMLANGEKRHTNIEHATTVQLE